KNNTVSASTLRGYINTIASANPLDDNNASSVNARGLPRPPNGALDIRKNEVSGWELDITANLTRNWRLVLNGSLTGAYQTDTYPLFLAYYRRNEATLRGILEDAGALFNGDVCYLDPAIDPGRSRDGPAAVQAWNNLQNNLASITSERQKLSGLVERTANLYTDYAFRNGPLKGLRIGIGANYRGKRVIAFRGGDTIEDPANPGTVIDDPSVGPLDAVYSPAYTTATATASYNWRVSRKLTVLLNLRVANLFDYDKPLYYGALARPVNGDLANPGRTMTPVQYRWLTPRQFTFTATLRF
ncbi:MAG: TonB-dependent receptor, partial [Opitutaceae bacterium]|nr:TonB-dependent receptor [Opitutaceae bacterium]